MADNRHVILNYVDSPLKIIIWTRVEIIMYILPAMCGLMFNQLLFGFTISILNCYLNSKYKKRFGKGQFQAVSYWFLPSGHTFKKVPPSHTREYLS